MYISYSLQTYKQQIPIVYKSYNNVGHIITIIYHLLWTSISTYDDWNKQPKHVIDYSIRDLYEGWNFNSGNYLFTTDTK